MTSPEVVHMGCAICGRDEFPTERGMFVTAMCRTSVETMAEWIKQIERAEAGGNFNPCGDCVAISRIEASRCVEHRGVSL